MASFSVALGPFGSLRVPLGALLLPLGCPWAPFRSLWGGIGSLWDAIGLPLGRPWLALGALGSLWVPLGSLGGAQCSRFAMPVHKIKPPGTRHRKPREPPEWCQELRFGAHLPHAPGVRMTVVTHTPSKYQISNIKYPSIKSQNTKYTPSPNTTHEKSKCYNVHI